MPGYTDYEKALVSRTLKSWNIGHHCFSALLDHNRQSTSEQDKANLLFGHPHKKVFQARTIILKEIEYLSPPEMGDYTEYMALQAKSALLWAAQNVLDAKLLRPNQIRSLLEKSIGGAADTLKFLSDQARKAVAHRLLQRLLGESWAEKATEIPADAGDLADKTSEASQSLLVTLYQKISLLRTALVMVKQAKDLLDRDERRAMPSAFIYDLASNIADNGILFVASNPKSLLSYPIYRDAQGLGLGKDGYHYGKEALCAELLALVRYDTVARIMSPPMRDSVIRVLYADMHKVLAPRQEMELSVLNLAHVLHARERNAIACTTAASDEGVVQKTKRMFEAFAWLRAEMHPARQPQSEATTDVPDAEDSTDPSPQP